MTGSFYNVGTTNTHWMYLKRKVNITKNLASSDLVVTGSTLSTVMPDGAKILKVKVVGRDCRNVRVKVPAGTRLFERGGFNGEVQALQRESWAPLSRFPTLTVDVPDTLASAIDTNDTTNELFSVQSNDKADATVTLTVWFLTMV
jgi:hypothetical protein